MDLVLRPLLPHWNRLCDSLLRGQLPGPGDNLHKLQLYKIFDPCQLLLISPLLCLTLRIIL